VLLFPTKEKEKGVIKNEKEKEDKKKGEQKSRGESRRRGKKRERRRTVEILERCNTSQKYS
jgi:hypothetical protein